MSKINGDLNYRKDTIENMQKEFGFSQVQMNGFRDIFLKLKPALEAIYDEDINDLSHMVSDAPFFGWDGDSLAEMKKIESEIDKRVMEIYAIVLSGLGE